MPRAGRIVHITEAFTGGVRTHLCQLLRGLQGWDQVLIASPYRDRQAPRMLEALRSEGHPVIQVPMVRHPDPVLDPVGLALLVYHLRRLRPAIVHTHSAKAGLLGRLAARLAGLPVSLYTPHALPFHQEVGPFQGAAYRALERVAGRWTTAIIAVSPSEADEILAANLAPPEQIRVIPNGVELPPGSRNSEEARVQLGLPMGPPVVLCVGAARKQKAPLDWLKMAKKVLQTRSEVLFLWVGGDGFPLWAGGPVRILAERLGASVRSIGYLADPAPAYQAATVFALASHWEGCPYSLLEAMSWGLPCAATSVTGSRDAIRHGESGLLSPPGDPTALAANVLRHLQHPEEAKRMGARARVTVERQHSLAGFLQRHEQLYGELLGAVAEERE